MDLILQIRMSFTICGVPEAPSHASKIEKLANLVFHTNTTPRWVSIYLRLLSYKTLLSESVVFYIYLWFISSKHELLSRDDRMGTFIMYVDVPLHTTRGRHYLEAEDKINKCLLC